MGCGSSADSNQSQSANAPTKMAAKDLKAPTGLVSDVTFKLPHEDLQKSCGLALDIGSTLGKIVYRSNKDYKDGKPINPEAEGQAHFALFPRSDVQGMIKYIKENCDLTENEEGEIIVYCAGVGGAAFRVEIEAGLSCKFNIIPETDCFVKGLVTLEKIMTEEELCVPVSQKVQDEMAAMKAQMKDLMEKMKAQMDSTKFVEDTQPSAIKDEDRPKLLIMAGSGTGVFQMNADETCTVLSGLWTAGRFMYGLSSMLTGENDFSKLKEMAEKGDGKSCDIWTEDLLGDANNAGGDDNMYEQARETNMMLFPFGKGVTVQTGKMKKEDIVHSVFNTTAMIHAQEISTQARMVNAKRVYVAGNVFNSEIMRDLITIAHTKLSLMLPENQNCEFYFLKNGGMYGALGAFVHTKKQQASS